MRALLSSRGPVWRWARAGAEMSRRSQRAFQTGSRLMMPSRFNADLPAFKQLQAEGVWVEAAGAPGQAELEKTMPHVKILILNLMPLKEETDLQVLHPRSPAPPGGRFSVVPCADWPALARMRVRLLAAGYPRSGAPSPAATARGRACVR